MYEDDEPELAGYQPIDDRPLQRARKRKVMRVIVILALVALIAPAVLTTLSVASRTAAYTCRVYVARYQPNAQGSSARFDLTGPAGPGWYCYTLDSEEDATFLVPLGLIPSSPRPPRIENQST